jgi:divalent metal cation (Fe/Co/Zn/Cd) transporter
MTTSIGSQRSKVYKNNGHALARKAKTTALGRDWRRSIVRADAAESVVCGYLALIALAGLFVNAVWSVGWADAVAALVLLPLIVREGWEAMKGKACCGEA